MARGARAAEGEHRGRHGLAIATAILVCGLIASLAGALLWRASARTNDRQSFQTQATAVSETVGTLLRRDSDFVGTLRAVLTIQPRLGQTEFDRWYLALEGRDRQVGSIGTTVVSSVAASQLAGFLAARNGDRRFRELIAGPILPVAITGRARYCLIATGESVVGTLSREFSGLVQGDWCQPGSAIGFTQAKLQLAATDSGQLLVFTTVAEGLHPLVFDAAFYRPGASLATVARRRAAVEGWVLSSFDVATVIRAATDGHGGLAVRLYHSNPGAGRELVGQAGSAAPADAFRQTSVFAIQGPWTVTVAGGPPATWLSPEVQGLLVLLGGMLVSVLLSALVLVLTRSRERALSVVAEKTRELRHQALHDALTDLPNRVLALDRAEQMLARARRLQLPVAALYVDVDGFKHVNDTFGHAAGDELLRTVAERLAGVVRGGDTAARLGGDEFVVLVEGSSLDAGPEVVAERLLEVLRQPYEIGGETGRQLSLSASIGVSCGIRDSADTLLADADVALYEAKATGRNRYMLYRSGMQTIAQDRLTLEMDLLDALARDELFLVYQPTFELRTETVTGVEALLRWRHPTRGTLSPDVFIPVAEEGDLIIPIGRWVLAEACRRAAGWNERGHRLSVAVNVSARQLESDGLIEDVRRALEDTGLEPGLLILEVTETTIMRDADATASRLRAFKRLGVRIAIDDFGTGYSSLAYLRQFPADELKIDRSFVLGMTASRQSAALIHTLVALGRTLKLETLAEGIEEPAQLATLRREGCDLGQGYLFSRPLEPDALEAFLESARGRGSFARAR
jgi:diguanylate cyclase (GGDEF)-like protein